MECCCREHLKQSPSIDNLTRKRIWEENFKIRENLKEIQQSEHFWSFQMANGGCCALSKPLHTGKRYASLQNLNHIGSSTHCESVNTRPRAAFPSSCQLHKASIESPNKYRRDVGTETLPMCFDKSVGPEYRFRQARLPSYSYETPPTPFQNCSRYKPSNWGHNDAKQCRQQSLQKLRKNEEALRQSIERSKKGMANSGRWGTEYSRSYKDSSWPRPLDNRFHSRAGTPMPWSIVGRHVGFRGAETPLPRHAGG